MDTQTDILGMLELMNAPAFCVKDAKVHQMNTAARQLMLEQDMPLSALLQNQLPEYQAFGGGCLFVTLHLCGLQLDATVNRIGQEDIFIIDQQAQSELRVMSLVAQHLRLPFADVLTITDRLMPALEAEADETQKRQISLINRKLAQLNRVMLNMADAARYTANANMRLTVQDIVSVIQEILDRAEMLLEHTAVELEIQLLQEAIFCPLDAEKLERAIYNLLSNAVKAAMPDGKVRFSLRKKNNWLYISVEDSGSGIPASIMSNIFTRYQRTPGLEDGYCGLGLGMVLVRAAATAHGGTVLIQQPATGGTRITLSIPIKTQSHLPLSSPILQPDYAGERDHGLLELSEVLPPDLYTYKK